MGADEDLGSVEQAFNQSGCTYATPVATLPSHFNYTSTINYGTNCNAVDVSVYSSKALYTHVSWGSLLPENKTDCEKSYLRSLHYNGSTSGDWLIAGDVAVYGIWFGTYCGMPYIDLDNEAMVRATPQRLATTARWYTAATGTYAMKRFTMVTIDEPR